MKIPQLPEITDADLAEFWRNGGHEVAKKFLKDTAAGISHLPPAILLSFAKAWFPKLPGDAAMTAFQDAVSQILQAAKDAAAPLRLASIEHDRARARIDTAVMRREFVILARLSGIDSAVSSAETRYRDEIDSLVKSGITQRSAERMVAPVDNRALLAERQALLAENACLYFYRASRNEADLPDGFIDHLDFIIESRGSLPPVEVKAAA